MNDNQKIALAAISGAAVGILAGLLFAPQKGADTRQQIVDKADEVKGGLEDMVDKGKDAINNLKSTIVKEKEAIKEKVA